MGHSEFHASNRRTVLTPDLSVASVRFVRFVRFVSRCMESSTEACRVCSVERQYIGPYPKCQKVEWSLK